MQSPERYAQKRREVLCVGQPFVTEPTTAELNQARARTVPLREWTLMLMAQLYIFSRGTARLQRAFAAVIYRYL